MKKERLIYIIPIILYLILFLPVFSLVVIKGNKVNYNNLYKIIIMHSNYYLLAAGVVVMIALIPIYKLLSKIRYNAKVLLFFLIVLAIAMYAVNIFISKCIAFYGGWDCGMVANSARWLYEGADIGYDDYYYYYSNNIPITWFLYKLYALAKSIPWYPYNAEFIWIQAQCLELSIAMVLITLTVLNIFNDYTMAIISAIISTVILTFSPWKIIPYTDGFSIVFPILTIFLYSLMMGKEKTLPTLILWFLIILTGLFGGFVKATVYIPLFGIIIVDTVRSLFRIKTMWSTCIAKIIILIFTGILFIGIKKSIYSSVNYEENKNLEMTWSNYLYLGSNDETTGAVSDKGLTLAREYSDASASERREVELTLFKESIENRGIGATIDFYQKKLVMTYNDGTFSWFQEGAFNAWSYENLLEVRGKYFLRELFWEDGPSYYLFNTISQGMWLFVLFGSLIMVISLCISLFKKDKIKNCHYTSIVTVVSLLGILLFVMLFEGRARYLYNFLPVFILACMAGISNIFSHSCSLTQLFKAKH